MHACTTKNKERYVTTQNRNNVLYIKIESMHTNRIKGEENTLPSFRAKWDQTLFTRLETHPISPTLVLQACTDSTNPPNALRSITSTIAKLFYTKTLSLSEVHSGPLENLTSYELFHLCSREEDNNHKVC